MEIKIGSVSWVNALAFDTERGSPALIADVGKFQHVTLKPNGNRYTLSNFFGSKKGGSDMMLKAARAVTETIVL